MDQTSRIFPVLPLRLRVTRPQPCAYLAGQQEQRLAGDISARPEEHDSLAEAYMLAGDKARAVAHYQQSLRLKPDNDNAVAMLKKLR